MFGFKTKKKRPVPEMGDHLVWHYDDNDEATLATPIVFTCRSDALAYIVNHCDPRRDPYTARRE